MSSTTEDKLLLKEILEIADNLLGKVADPWADLLFSEPLREDIRKAWPPTKKQIDELKRRIAQATSELSKNLKNAGLTGDSLRPKHRGAKESASSFKKSGGISRLKRCFNWLGIPLGSIPGAEPIKEFVEVVKRGMEHAAEPLEIEVNPLGIAGGSNQGRVLKELREILDKDRLIRVIKELGEAGSTEAKPFLIEQVLKEFLFAQKHTNVEERDKWKIIGIETGKALQEIGLTAEEKALVKKDYYPHITFREVRSEIELALGWSPGRRPPR